MTPVDDLREPHREQCSDCKRHWSTCACSEDPDLARRLLIARALRAADEQSALELMEAK